MGELLQATIGEAVADRMVQLAADVIKLISDGDAATKRLADLAEATAKANAAIDAANRATAESEKAVAAHNARMRKEQSDHETAMRGERQRLERDRQEFEKWTIGQKKAADDLVAKAKSDSDAAAKLKSDLENRLSAIRSAAA